MDLLQFFQKHIKERFPFLKNKKLLIAASGGLDSSVCVHLLHKLNFQISLAHCNFNLRNSDSTLDELAVKEAADKLKVPFFVEHFQTITYAQNNKLSIQMAARELRYDWFKKLMSTHRFDYLVTAHHLDDSLETFLINLTRGTGLDGLTGIPDVNNKIIRPLLPFPRDEIKIYAEKNNISWREDSSNTDTKYLRNNLRHNIIPNLKALNPNFSKSFSGTLENLIGSQQIVEDRIKAIESKIRKIQNDIQFFDIDQIKKLSNPKAYLFELLKGYGFSEWGDINNLLNAQSGKKIYSKSHRLLKDRKFLLLGEKSLINDNKVSLIEEGAQEFNNIDLSLRFDFIDVKDIINSSKNVISVDKSLLKYPLVVRKWKKGDYFCPYGLHGKKKISKYFKDEKISIFEKERTWILCTSENLVVWIIGMRFDDRFKVTKKTIEILKIENETNS